jgi:SAM-dependent methyltransferase
MWPRRSRYLERHIDEALARLGPRARVLEVGCGMGRYTLALHRRGVRVEGLDLSEALLERLREFSGQPTEPVLHAGDLLDPPAALLGQFDAVMGFFVLHHLPDLRAGFAGVRALLRPGGRAVFIEPNAWNPLFTLQIALTPNMSFRAEQGIFDMRERPLAQAVRAARLAPLAFERFGLAPPAVVDCALGARLERALECLPGPHWSRAFLSIACDRL